MQLLIDGHNLIGQMPDIRLDDPHDEAMLSFRLKQYCLRYHHHCTVIFDNGIVAGHSRLSSSQVTVIFAPRGVPADQLLIRRIRSLSDVAGMAIVTSDRAIVSEADRRKLTVIRSRDFATIISAPNQPVVEDVGENPNPIVTAAEVAYWLEAFGATVDQPDPSVDQFLAFKQPLKPKKKAPKRKKGGHHSLN